MELECGVEGPVEGESLVIGIAHGDEGFRFIERLRRKLSDSLRLDGTLCSTTSIHLRELKTKSLGVVKSDVGREVEIGHVHKLTAMLKVSGLPSEWMVDLYTKHAMIACHGHGKTYIGAHEQCEAQQKVTRDSGHVNMISLI